MKKILEGTIISEKMKKTVVVKTETFKVDPKYRKRFRVFKKYKADTGGNTCKIGDRVLIEESRPISKDKCWRVVKKIEGVKREISNEEVIDDAKSEALNPKS